MTNKAPFCAFWWLTITVLSRQIRSLPAYQVILWSLPTYQVGLWPLPTCQVDPRNLRNLSLMNDLRLRKITYEKINLFMQNEPNFRKSQVNVNVFIKSNYVQMDTWSIRKNEPKTNPNEPKTNPILADKTTIRTQNEPNSNPISDYPCIFELAVYNLVFRGSNITNFNGVYLKWQMHRKPMQW
jgi:hypothetical protein